MAPKAAKRKAEAAVEPVAKEDPKVEAAAKVDAAAAAETVVPEAKKAKVEVEEKVEQETDAGKITKAITGPVEFHTPETTLNVVPVFDGRVLTSLSDGGMQYLIAGARANTGIKTGRYMYEVKMFDTVKAGGDWNSQGPKPRQLLRVGLSTKSSSLILGESEEHVFFDSEGFFVADKKKNSASKRFFREQVVALLVNLDAKSPNKNTLSLFVNGVRVAQPQAIPEGLVGKTLFPHVAFRNLKVQVNFGPKPLKELPFKCHMVGGASDKDVEVVAKAEPKNGKFDVVFPITYPDEGTFEWADTYLKANPHLTELSDRKIIEWAVASEVYRPNPNPHRSNNDKPDFNFGLPGMDDFSIRKVLNSISSVIPRHYFIMEVKANLVEADRKVVLQRFSSSKFKKIAQVAIGEPDAAFKKSQHELILQDKQKKADGVWKSKKAELERKKVMIVKQKEIAERKKKAVEAKKVADAERKEKLEAIKKAKEAKEAEKKDAEKKEGENKEGEKKEGDDKMEVDAEEKKEEPKKEEPKEDEKKDDKMEVDEKKDEEKKKKEEEEEKKEAEEKQKEADLDAEIEKMGAEPPKVELTDEDTQKWFREKTGSKDLHPKQFDNNFALFSIPEKTEGFDLIQFAWQKDGEAKKYLHSKIKEKKHNTVVEHLTPGEWFKEKYAEFTKRFTELKEKLEKKPEAAKAEGDKTEEKKDDDEKADVECDDLFAVADICDIGGVALFKNFGFEDWALCQLRFELWLMQIAFQKDVNDADRPAIRDVHLDHYYNKYFRKQLNPKSYGVENFADLFKMIKDTSTLNDEGLTSPLEGDELKLDDFVKHCEEHRRERQRRIDAGDETARLKINKSVFNAPAERHAKGASKGGNWKQGSQKGSGKGNKKW